MLNQTYIKAILLAIFHFMLTTFFEIDRLYFDYPIKNTEHMVTIKMLYFIFLVIAYLFIFNVIKKIKEQNRFYIRGLKLFSIYFSILMGLILLVWPGLWSWDDAWCLVDETRYDYTPWQHILTGFKDMVFLQVFPFVGGILIVSNAVIAIAVSFSIVKLENLYNLFLKNKFLDYFLKILPFLLFPVLRFQLSGYRMGLYVYLEIAMFVMLLCAIKNKEKWDIKYFLLFSFLVIICSVWRTESFLYIPIICLLLFLLKQLGSLRNRLAVITLILIGSFFISMMQKIYLQNTKYEVVSTIRQCTQIVRASNQDEDQALLEDINKVIKIQVILDNPNSDGEYLLWGKNLIRDYYTKTDYKKYLIAFLKLCQKYPIALINERTNLFLNTSGIMGNINSPGYERIVNLLLVNRDPNSVSSFFIGFGKKFFMNNPISKAVRQYTTRIITLNQHFFLYIIVWNIIPPIIILFVYGYILLSKRSWKEVLLVSMIVGKMLLIFLTAPGPYMMYYLSFYIMGYLILDYWIIYQFSKVRCFKK